MNSISKYLLNPVSLIVLLILSGCAVSYYQTATPALKAVETEMFSISFEPKKDRGNLFSSFVLVIKNKTDHSIEIDWNKTYYLHNNVNQGTFLFEGVRPADLKAETVPNETILPDSSLTKRISPKSKIALTPLKGSGAIGKKTGFYPGSLPAGRNSIVLAIWNNGELINQTITVLIKEEKNK